MNNLNNFTNQYQVSKTLRFELIPQGKTLENIQKNQIIIHDLNDTDNPLKGNDAKRAENYKYAKKIIDAMHRNFIEDCFNHLNIVVNEKGETTQSKLIELFRNFSTVDDIESHKKELSAITKEQYDIIAIQWIAQAKSDYPLIWQDDLSELQDKLKNTENNQQKKKINNAIKKVQKKIKDGGTKLKFKNSINALYSNTDTMQLLEWQIWKDKIKISGKNIGINDSDEPLPKAALINIIRSFDGFHSYFSGFNENRANVYEHKEFLSTSIIFRTFEQNLQFHLDNIKTWQTVLRSIEKHKSILENNKHYTINLLEQVEDFYSTTLEKFMKPESFVDFLSQSGIDKYNRILGGEPSDAGKNKIQGLNEIINLTRQQAQAKRNQYPPLSKLYKQILSLSEGFYIDEFKNDKELCEAVNEFHALHFIEKIDNHTYIQRFENELSETLKAADVEADHIYIAKDKLRKISTELTGSWHTITDWIEACLKETDIKKINKKSTFSIGQLRTYFNQTIEGNSFYDKFNTTDEESLIDPEKPLLSLLHSKTQTLISKIHSQWEALKSNGILKHQQINKNNNSKPGDKGFEQIAAIKTFLEACINLRQFIGLFTMPHKKRPENCYSEWYRFIDEFNDGFDVFLLYNKCRNYLTRKPYSTEKLKLTFNKPTLLDGWDRNKESANLSVILKKEEQFYLAIMSGTNTALFDYDVTGTESDKIQQRKETLAKEILSSDENNNYKKMNYKLLPGPNKMLPKVFFAKSNLSTFKPSDEIIKIKEQKLYSKTQIEKHGIENLHKYITFCIQSLLKHPEWAKAYGFNTNSFNEPSSYNSIDEFYRDVELMGYKLTFDHIKAKYIEEKVENGELYLFQIYNKDFSTKKKSGGKDNLHTSYWKHLFERQNLNDVVIKLNGQAEIFFRPASIEYKQEKWQKGHHVEELKDKFNYPIIKNKRYAKDKFLFHCPITLNFKSASQPIKFNDEINRFLRRNEDINIIGIDRGEKHLLYFSVTDQNGRILEQGSFNSIDNGYIPQGKTKSQPKNYLKKLSKMEGSRDDARKSWSKIENIKEMKSGYLSHVVHKLAHLIIKYNAIVILENLNHGFKRGRFKVERQVYQKFEKALIDKLNYLVFKDRTDRTQAGHYLNAYQLTNKFNSFEKLGTQSGILFYTSAAYTSTTDPITGYLRNVYRKYQNLETAQSFWLNFETIRYNTEAQRFEFTYNRKNLAGIQLDTEQKDKTTGGKDIWTVCSCVQRSEFNRENKSHTMIDVHQEIIALFEKTIKYQNGQDLRDQISTNDDVSFHKSLFHRFNQILTMRVTDPQHASGTSENDFIQSPVEPFFDSRKSTQSMPKDGDANGAYNIARKGICILQKLHDWDGKDKSPKLSITKKDWEDYCQSDDVVIQQREKAYKGA